MGNVKHAFTSAKADGGDATQVRPSNWNAAHTGAVEILDRDLTQIDVANEAAETSIYSFSIPANTLGATGGVRLTLGGDVLANVAGTLVLVVKLGATIAIQSTGFDFTDAVERYKWTWVTWFLNVNASSQKWNTWAQFVSHTASTSVRIGGDAPMAFLEGYTTSAENTTGALTLGATINWSVANASLSFRKEMALLELIPAA